MATLRRWARWGWGAILSGSVLSAAPYRILVYNASMKPWTLRINPQSAGHETHGDFGDHGIDKTLVARGLTSEVKWELNHGDCVAMGSRRGIWLQVKRPHSATWHAHAYHLEIIDQEGHSGGYVTWLPSADARDLLLPTEPNVQTSLAIHSEVAFLDGENNALIVKADAALGRKPPIDWLSLYPKASPGVSNSAASAQAPSPGA